MRKGKARCQLFYLTGVIFGVVKVKGLSETPRLLLSNCQGCQAWLLGCIGADASVFPLLSFLLQPSLIYKESF